MSKMKLVLKVKANHLKSFQIIEKIAESCHLFSSDLETRHGYLAEAQSRFV